MDFAGNRKRSGRIVPSIPTCRLRQLPCQLPADMETVEEQCEDVPCDMRPYVDSEGNSYDFAFGLNGSGVIRDERVKKYGKGF